MKIYTIAVGIYAANCYILFDEKCGDITVIDPGGDSDVIIKDIEKLKGNVKYILLTHGHSDHLGAVSALKEKYNVPIGISLEDQKYINNGEYMFGPLPNNKADINLFEGTVIKFADREIKCIATPGHTKGSMCFIMDNIVFTGDTLFSGSIGRTDFSGGDFSEIIKSIKEKIFTLNEDYKIYPGHGLESTIKYEKLNNPFF